MKENIDDDLIITNDITEETSDKDSATGNSAETSKAQANDDDGISFKEFLHDNVKEEDSPNSTTRTLIQVLGGEFFTAKIMRRQIWLILLISVFAVIYISNRYSCQKSFIEIAKLNAELQDAKYKALSVSSEMTERSRESHVLDVLKEIGDSSIKIATEPPYYINIPE